MRPPRWYRVLATGGCFAAFFLGAGLFSWLYVPVLAVRTRGLPPPDAIRLAQRALLPVYRAFAWILVTSGVCTWRRPPLPPDLPSGPYVLVANHPSLLDVMVILATVPNICCLVKRSWFSNPLVGPLLRRGGHLPGPDPDGGTEGPSILEGIVERLGEGIPVLVFPEGSRSPAGSLRRFKRGAVEAALQAGVPLLPVFVGCDPPTLLRGQSWYDVPERPFDLTLDFLPVMDPRSEGEDSRLITRRLAASYAERVHMPPVSRPNPGQERSDDQRG